MCGICGMVSPSYSKEKITAFLSNMGKVQRHRGPDDKKEVVFSSGAFHLGLGFVRLSILDLDTGMQPIVCPEDGSAIICNGQIYNYLELTPYVAEEAFVSKGDIEVALHLFRKKGLDFLEYLNGMYAGAIYSPRDESLILFRDRFGIKPLYYTKVAETFLFASEIKPLLSAMKMINGRPAELNTKDLSTYFTYRYLPGEKTLFRGIHRLAPGSFLKYSLKDGSFSTQRYWQYRLDNVNDSISMDDAAEEFIDLLSDAVRIRLRADVEVGSLLSGGIDSSAVASIATKHRSAIRLFTIFFNEKKYNELPQVKKFLKIKNRQFKGSEHHVGLCSRKNLDYLPEIVRALEEPISLGTILPTDQICRMAGEHVKVVLTGEGADEIFAGYRKFLVESAAIQYQNLPPQQQKELEIEYPELKSYLSVRHDDPVKRYIQSELLFHPGELKVLLGKDIDEVMFPEDARPMFSGREHPLNSAIAMESRARLPDYVILRLDKLSMSHSLETRTPFLDFRLAEFAASLPPDFKSNLEKGKEKYICSYALNRYGILDAATSVRKKQPFTIPLSEWLSEPDQLPESLQEILFGETLKRHGILNPQVMKKDVKNISTAGIGPNTLVSNADRVFSIIIFSLWYEEFFGTSAG
jgi:asparagine synthase (glutamine-hydrolysing)